MFLSFHYADTVFFKHFDTLHITDPNRKDYCLEKTKNYVIISSGFITTSDPHIFDPQLAADTLNHRLKMD